MQDQGQDPVVRDYRKQISNIDLTLLETINRRLQLVKDLHAYKTKQGYPPIDRSREQAVLEELARANDGPLSTDGLNELVNAVLDLTKRELDR